MPHFCSKCGSALEADSRFCPNCGTPVASSPAQESIAANDDAPGIPAPGFSVRVNDPEILAAVKKNRKAAGIFALIIAPLPLIGFLIYGATNDKMSMGQAFLFGMILTGIFAIFGIVGLVKNSAQKGYEATVLEKKTQIGYGNRESDGNRRMVTEYITIARATDGSTKRIVEREGSQIWAYHYLDVGDRFRYHPQFHFPYEKYDKSKAPYIACVSCGTKNPVSADRCSRCHIPLLK